MKKAIGVVSFVGILSAFCTTASAHRIDEYLQAARLAIAPDRVTLEMDLTPGVDVAPLIFALINTDHDGSISDAEGRAYASQLLKEVVLTLDGHPQRLSLVRVQFPSFQEMSDGVGVIRIEAVAICASTPGQHVLFYQNNHKNDISVYLVNALLPASHNIEIVGQRRDPLQRGIQLRFTVGH
jgi:hypothetical protein